MLGRLSPLRGGLFLIALGFAVSACSGGSNTNVLPDGARTVQAGGVSTNTGGGGGVPGGGGTVPGGGGTVSTPPVAPVAPLPLPAWVSAMSSSWSANHTTGANTINTSVTVAPQGLLQWKVEYINDLTGESEHTEWGFDFNFSKYTISMPYTGAKTNTPYNTRLTLYDSFLNQLGDPYSQTTTAKGIVTPTVVPAAPTGCATTIDSFVPAQARSAKTQYISYTKRILTCQPITWRIDSTYFYQSSDLTTPPQPDQVATGTGSSDRSITDSGVASNFVASGNWQFTLTVMDVNGNTLASTMVPANFVFQP